jgi:hypothetical protein
LQSRGQEMNFAHSPTIMYMTGLNSKWIKPR